MTIGPLNVQPETTQFDAKAGLLSNPPVEDVASPAKQLESTQVLVEEDNETEVSREKLCSNYNDEFLYKVDGLATDTQTVQGENYGADKAKELANVKQKSKLSRADYKKVNSLFNALKTHPDSAIFRLPVDPIKDHCFDYYDKIKNPISIKCIQEKLFTYDAIEEFLLQVKLMIMNCFYYNPQGNYCRKMGKSVGSWFQKQAKSIFDYDLDYDEFMSEICDEQYRKRASTRDNEEEEEVEYKPKKRRLAPNSFHPIVTPKKKYNNELQSLSNSLETMNKQLEKLEKSQYLITPSLSDSSDSTHVDSKPMRKKTKPKQQKSVPKEERFCEYCHTNQTPMWRRGPSGKATLCNKCGVKWRAGKVLQHQDGTILQPPSPATLARPIKANSKPRKANNVIESSVKVSYAQKEHVASVLTLGTLNSDQICHIVTMIRNNVPGLKYSTEEIEIDMEQLDPKLVGEMYRYVVETVGLKPML